MLYTSSGRGVDQFAFDDGTVWTAAILASHIITGTSGNDVLNGGIYRDYISGGNGNDIVSGGLGHDIIDGGAGNDTLNGGAGNDALIGGTGNDTFIFELGGGNDRVDGFVAGPGSDDVMDVWALGFTIIDQILSAATQDGNDAILQLDAATTVRLTNVQVSQLHQDDFLFALT